ncbi:MAG: hypothetical protein ICCCNLDF_01642 [Planctomycetes bacterium]|nr:hypothetical protein [Planctomycetota bacterium]
MRRRAIVHPLFQNDIDEAVVWYEGKSPGLGARFEGQLNACLHKVEERPLSFQAARGSLRQARLDDFPFGVIFEVSEDLLLIYGLFHLARDRSVWESRT